MFFSFGDEACIFSNKKLWNHQEFKGVPPNATRLIPISGALFPAGGVGIGG